MKIRVIGAVALFLILICSSCISDLEFEPDRDLENSVSIQAILVKGDVHTITVNTRKVRDFSGRNTPVLVQTATLFNDRGQFIDIPLVATGVNRLRIAPDSREFLIDDFMTFYIQVTTDDGRLLQSDSEQLLPVPQIDNLRFEIIEILEIGPLGDLIPEDQVGFFIDTDALIPNSSEPLRLRWTFEEVYEVTDTPSFRDPKTCYVFQGLGAVAEIIVNPEDVGSTDLRDWRIFERDITFTYAEANTFVAMQHSLTPTAFDYFDAVRTVINRSGSAFDAPAGLIPTNLFNVDNPTEEVFGFLYATELDTARIFVPKEATGNVARRCPPSRSDVVCNDCLNENRSTLTRPIWWTEQ